MKRQPPFAKFSYHSIGQGAAAPSTAAQGRLCLARPCSHRNQQFAYSRDFRTAGTRRLAGGQSGTRSR